MSSKSLIRQGKYAARNLHEIYSQKSSIKYFVKQHFSNLRKLLFIFYATLRSCTYRFKHRRHKMLIDVIK